MLIWLFETTDCHLYCTEPNASPWGRRETRKDRAGEGDDRKGSAIRSGWKSLPALPLACLLPHT